MTFRKIKIDPWGKRHPRWRKLKVLRAKLNHNRSAKSFREILYANNP